MTVRLLPYVLVFALGLGTSGLAACGGSSDGATLIPSADAGPLKSDLDRVTAAIDDHDCVAAQDALGQVQSDIDSLPADVDRSLRDRLQQGYDTLRRQTAVECVDTTTTTTETQTTETETTPTDTSTDTLPTDTSTDTLPTDTATDTLPTETTPTTPTPTPNPGGTDVPTPGADGGASTP